MGGTDYMAAEISGFEKERRNKKKKEKKEEDLCSIENQFKFESSDTNAKV